jgi:hypothetical protein
MSSRFFYKDTDYCESSNIDLMFSHFDDEQKNIIKMLKENPDELVGQLWNANSPVSKDDQCLFQMGKYLALPIDDILEHDERDPLVNFYICPHCKNMKRIMEFTSIKKTLPNEPFILECGNKAGTLLYYIMTPINFLHIEKKSFSSNPNIVKAFSHPQIYEVMKCSSDFCEKGSGSKESQNFKISTKLESKFSEPENLKRFKEMSYINSDPFTNGMLINWFLQSSPMDLNHHMEDNPHILHNYLSFICQREGYNLYEYLDIGHISSLQSFPQFLATSDKPSPTAKADDKYPLSRDITKQILIQLFAILHSSQRFEFSHGNPCFNSIKFKKEIISYEYDGITISSPITLKLLDFSSSAITIGNCRYYSKNVIGEEELKKKNFDFQVEKFSIDTCKGEREEGRSYKLRDPYKYIKSSVLFMYMKHLGLPIYTSSFDAYAFMIVLMSERSFYTAVLHDNKLNTFWKNMWLNTEDYEKVNTRLEKFHEHPKEISCNDVLHIISNLSLRCDMIAYGWNQVKYI